MIADPDLLERLRAHQLFSALPPEETAWVAAHGQRRQIEEGEILSSPTEGTGMIDSLVIVLSGRIAIWLDRGMGPRKTLEWGPGEITGRLPYSRQAASAGEVRVEEPGETVIVHRALFPELIRECPELTARLVHEMLDRARHFTRSDLQNEKMISLGRLSAGLAHELDNPASALVRGAKQLMPALEQAEAAALALGELRFPAERLTALEALRQQGVTAQVQRVRSPLEQARHEEALMDWLESRGVDADSAEALAESPITVAMLNSLAANVEQDALATSVRWLASAFRVSSLATDLGRAAVRISELVKAVKEFTYRDAAPVPQPVDVEAGLTQTLAVLHAKARGNRVGVSITVQPDLPPVQAVGSELNQVWFNLMDNALDAVREGGTVQVHAACKGENVIVSVVDDGPGVPAEIQETIFEPFFTTKPVGSGTGLGLDIVRRLVAQQNGSIELSSRPGHTEFRVTLPVARGDGRGV